MTDIKPRFFDTENKLIAHLEWEAIRILCFDVNHMNIADAYPKFEQRQFYWTQKYYDNATDEHHSIKRKITKNEYMNLLPYLYIHYPYRSMAILIPYQQQYGINPHIISFLVSIPLVEL